MEDRKQTLQDHFTLLRCWFPFVLFVGNVSVQLAFLGLRELIGHIPLQHFMGCQHQHLAILWNLGYGAICSTMSEWIFPGMPTTPISLACCGTIMAVNFFFTLWAFNHEWASASTQGVLSEVLNSLCDVVSTWAFVFIFSYNCFGPNQHVIYMIADFDYQEKVNALIMIMVNLMVNVAKLMIIFHCIFK